MIPIFAVGDPHTAIRLLAGRAVLVSHAYLGAKHEEGTPKPRRGDNEWIPWADLLRLIAVAALVWCDSGAFTYWNRMLKGKPGPVMNVEKWAAFVIENYDLFAQFVAPDVIGDGAATLRNWLALLEMVPPGKHAKLVPVWHEGDPIEHLHAYSPDVRIVALGRTEGRKPGPTGKKCTMRFYDQAFNAYPEGQYHALGNGSPDTIEPFPFVCFDNTTWQKDAAYSEADGFPWNKISKETRMLAYIEGAANIRHVPRVLPKQTTLWGD